MEKPRWAAEQTRHIRNRALGSGLGGYKLSNRDTEDFKVFWNKLEQPDVRDRLEVAIRRVGDSCIRHRNEDKIVDLMIAAESLFLRGSNTRSKGSLIAQSAANCLEADEEARKKVEKHFTIAYQLRNAIVHEGNLENFSKVTPSNLDEFVGRTQGLMRLAILKRLGI